MSVLEKSVKTRTIKLFGYEVPVPEEGEVVLVSSAGVYSSRRGVVAGEECGESLEYFSPFCAVVRDGVVIEYGVVHYPGMSPYTAALVYRVGARPIEAETVVELGEPLVIHNRLGTIRVVGGVVEVDEGYREEYSKLLRELEKSSDYHLLALAAYYHPLVQAYFAKRYHVIPPEPMLGRTPEILEVKGLTDIVSLQPYVNPAPFDLMLLADIAEGVGPTGFAWEFIEAVLHELVHAARDLAGEAKEGEWFLGLPLGEEAEVEREAHMLLSLLEKDEALAKAVRGFALRRAEEVIGFNPEAFRKITAAIQLAREAGVKAWLHTGRTSVMEYSVEEGGIVDMTIIVPHVGPVAREVARRAGGELHEEEKEIVIPAEFYFPGLEEVEVVEEEW